MAGLGTKSGTQVETAQFRCSRQLDARQSRRSVDDRAWRATGKPDSPPYFPDAACLPISQPNASPRDSSATSAGNPSSSVAIVSFQRFR